MEQPIIRSATARPPVYVAMDTLVAPHRPLPEALEVAIEAGADGFELHQEVLAVMANPDDMEDLPPLFARFPAPPALAVPQPLFRAGEFQLDVLRASLVQCRALGFRLLTFPLGGVSRLSGETLDVLRETRVPERERVPDVRVTVVNDPTTAHADLHLWGWVLERTASWKDPIHLTFDLGTWTCVSVDAVAAAKVLGRYVAAVRVGRFLARTGQCIALPLQRADRVHPALEYLPADAPRVLACPPSASEQRDRELLVVALHETIERLRAGTFTTEPDTT